MRTKLTEIISTMDQYNGIGAYCDKYKGGAQVDIQTDMRRAPKKGIITEEMERVIRDVLLAEHQQDSDLPSQELGTPVGELKSQILKFEEFVTERYFREESDEDYTDQFYEDDAEWYEKEEE